jgi:cytochrome c553
LRERRIHAERHIGRTEKLANRLVDDDRQALAAEFSRRREADPAASLNFAASASTASTTSGVASAKPGKLL